MGKIWGLFLLRKNQIKIKVMIRLTGGNRK